MSFLSVELLRQLKSAYNLSVFIESGCHTGDGIAKALAAGFTSVRSCDLSESCVNHCRERFSGDVEIFHGDSVAALSHQLNHELGSALFWLDAHYPAFYGMPALEDEATRFPVPQELEVIHRLRSGAERDVILIDDVRVIDAPDNPRWRPGEVPQYYIVNGLTIADLTAPFFATHEVRFDLAQEGTLILSPK